MLHNSEGNCCSMRNGYWQVTGNLYCSTCREQDNRLFWWPQDLPGWGHLSDWVERRGGVRSEQVEGRREYVSCISPHPVT